MATTTVPVTTSRRISEIDTGLNPAMSNGYLSAYLFATGVANAVKVRVPVTSTTPPTKASDVNFMIWVATDPNHPLTNLSYLEMDVGEEVGFMVFAPDQESPMGRGDLLHPVNAALAAQQQPAFPEFRGNVLVMRRDRRSSVFLDVRQEDLAPATVCAVGHSKVTQCCQSGAPFDDVHRVMYGGRGRGMSLFI
ncbi:hypothetical protein DFH06DRAFT_1121431 [Mycena polygramma]|nr:hypothetical protein DFH06DRAFT_1121431 [Mycena polygramma]